MQKYGIQPMFIHCQPYLGDDRLKYEKRRAVSCELLQGGNSIRNTKTQCKEQHKKLSIARCLFFLPPQYLILKNRNKSSK